jgi:hypothetical protein
MAIELEDFGMRWFFDVVFVGLVCSGFFDSGSSIIVSGEYRLSFLF